MLCDGLKWAMELVVEYILHFSGSFFCDMLDGEICWVACWWQCFHEVEDQMMGEGDVLWFGRY